MAKKFSIIIYLTGTVPANTYGTASVKLIAMTGTVPVIANS